MDEQRLHFLRYNRGWLLAAPDRELYWGLPDAASTGPQFQDDTRALFPCLEAPRRRLFIGARAESLEFWRAADALPWEDLEVEGRRLVNRGCVVVRSTGDVEPAAEPPPVLVVGEDHPRMLVLTASPAGRSFDARPFVDALQDAAREAHSPPPTEVRLTAGVDGERVVSDVRWDLVVILAHGHRTPTGGQVCLERAVDHDKDPHDYHEFATTLGNALGREFTGVIFLGVCASSRLAVELCHEMPRSRVIAFRSEEDLRLLQRFFAHFVRALFGLESARHTHETRSVVEDCYAATVRACADPHGRGRRLAPVLYAPTSATPPAFLDFSRLSFLRALRSVIAGKGLDAALEFARRYSDDTTDPARDVAAACSEELTTLTNYDHNLTRLAAVIDERAGTRRWQQCHAEFREFPFAAAATAGPMVIDDPSVPTPRLLLVDWQTLDGQRRVALDALEQLVRYESGDDLPALVAGCMQLDEFERARRRHARGELADRVFERECSVVFTGVSAALAAAADADALPALAAAAATLGRLQSVSEARPVGVQPRVREFVADLRAAVDGVPVARAEPAAPASGGRAEYVAALLARRGEPSTSPAAERFGPAPADLAELADHIRHVAARVASGPAVALADAPVALLVNERAPLWLCADLADGLHPYLLLAPHGAHPDACIDTLAAVGNALMTCDDPQRQDALAILRNTTFRLRLDFGLLPVEDPARASDHVQTAWRRALASEPAGDPPPLAPLDRLTALVVADRVPEAAAEAFAGFCRCVLDESIRPAIRFDWTRAVYVLCLHAAELTADADDKFVQLERVIAAIGMILGDKLALSRWIDARLAVYRQDAPDSVRLAQFHRELTQEIHRAFTRQLGLLAALPDGQAPAATLARELEAELRGAGLSHLLRGPRLPCFTGGYLAARAFARLDLVGARLREHYLLLTSSRDRTGLAAAKGLTAEAFHELVFCFSALRHFHVDEHELLDQPCYEDPEAPTFRERYPLHAALELRVADQVLGVHVALVTAHARIRHLRPVVQRRPLPRAEIVRRIVEIAELHRRLLGAKYRIGGDPVGIVMILDGLLTDWIDQELARMAAATVADALVRLEDVLMLIDNLVFSARAFTGILVPLRAKLAANIAALCVQRRDWLRALGYINQSIEEAPDEVEYMKSYLHIAANVYDLQRRENRAAAANILHDAIRRGEDLVRAAESTSARDLLDRLKHRRDSASLRPANPVDDEDDPA